MASPVLKPVFILALTSVLLTGTLQAADAPTDEFVQMIVKLIGDSDKEFRAAGLKQVRKAAPGAKFTLVFAAQLKKLELSGQAALLSALADRGDVAAHPAVIELLASSSETSVRVAALGALGSLGGPDDLPLLFKTLSATSNAEQAAARKSLVQLRGEAISRALATETKSAPPAVKAALIEVLATRRASDQMPAFLAASVDDNAQVRSAAMAALGQIGHPEQINAMLPGVLKAQ